MLISWLSPFLQHSSAQVSDGMLPISAYSDWATFFLTLSFILLAVNVTSNRRTFRPILQALFVPRVRSQFFRETKLYNEWVYAIGMLYNALIQGLFLFYLAILFLPATTSLSFPILYLICFGIFLVDHYFKFLNSSFLGRLFGCESEVLSFNHSKFFYVSTNSVVLLPILAVSIYLGRPALLFIYLPFFIVTYVMMLYRTLTIKKSTLSFFQFFLYFCTLEILPYLVFLKMLFSLR